MQRYQYAFRIENNLALSAAGSTLRTGVTSAGFLQSNLQLTPSQFAAFRAAAHRFAPADKEVTSRIRSLAAADRAKHPGTRRLSEEAQFQIDTLLSEKLAAATEQATALHRALSPSDAAQLDEKIALLYSEQLRKLSLETGSIGKIASSTDNSSDIRSAIQSIAGQPQPFANGGGGGFVCQYSDPDYDEQDAIDACEDDGGDYDLETCECNPDDGGGGGGGGAPAADNTPIITGIDPSVWSPGSTASVTFTGQYFGTNAPNLSFSPGSGIGYTLSTYSDTQIVASVNVASGTPNEDVAVAVTNNGYGGSAFYGGSSGQSPTSTPVSARVQAPLHSAEVTVIGWIDGSQITLPTNESTPLNLALTTNPSLCFTEVSAWALGTLGAVNGPDDVAYANAFLLKASANDPPPNSITPSNQALLIGTYRLFNDFGNSHGAVEVGWTPDPCHFVSAPIPAESSPYNGSAGVTSLGNTYQLAEGRVGTVGQKAYATLNNQQKVPWIWSVIEFNASGALVNITSPANYQIFPTYYVYLNGVLQSVYTRVQSSVSTIVEPTYSNSQLLPTQIQ